ncbi:MAG: hypothetical protein GXO50_08155, partial [Chlorobi bacterium]|nr:hypothetical protein [Chlorobiota bacterium]
KEFLKSDNCDTKCGLQASCEGKTVRLKGIIDEDNINEQNGTFRITDEDDENYYIDIAVDDGISEEIFSKIKDKGGMPVKTEGVAEGFDMPTNFTCKRGFFLKASDASEIIF